jgi:hypothetical protein
VKAPDNCLDCPAHKTVMDPSSGDSFDWHDEAVLCGHSENADGAKDYWGKPYPNRPVITCERPGSRKYTKRPTWCPLMAVKQ